MSNLLHSVLTSRLAAAEGLQDWEPIDQTSDDEMVTVLTPLASRPPSPSRMEKTLSGDKRKRRKKSKFDPLRAFSPEIAQHIFLHLGVNSLVSCSMVSKRWRRSATLNYCWYIQCHDAIAPPPLGSGGARWTRRESKTDWKTSFAKQRRIEAREQERLESLPGSGATTPSRTQRMADAGIQTAHEFRMEQWKQEEEQGYSKDEMREYYKSSGKGGKFKGKTGKGGVKTGREGDGGLWQ